MGRCAGSALVVRFWIFAAHPADVDVREHHATPDRSSVPWFDGTLIVTAGRTFGCRIRWSLLEPILLNCARIVASYSCRRRPASFCDSAPPAPLGRLAAFALAYGVEP